MIFKKNQYFASLKKIAAILLLILFVFNSVGYRLYISYVKDKEDMAFTATLDRGNYTDDELITVKIPINLPYQTNWKNFERIDGEITMPNGDVYKYVKRKIYNDTMILLCIQHDVKTRLEQKANEFFGKTNDLPGNETNKKADALKQIISDYEAVANTHESFVCTLQLTEFNIDKEEFLPSHFIPLHGEPPDMVA